MTLQRADASPRVPLTALLILFGCVTPVVNAATTGQSSNGRFRDRSGNSVSQSDSRDDFFTRLRNAFFRNRSNNDSSENAQNEGDDEEQDDDEELTEEERKEREHQKLLRQRLKEKHLKNKRKRQRGSGSSSASDPVVVAPTRTWNGAGTDANWMTDGNWTTGAPDPGDQLAFGGTTRLSNTNDFTAGSFSGLRFNSGAGSFTLSGNALTLTGPITNNSTSTQTISLPITLGANVTIGAASGDILIANSITGGFGIAKTGSATLSLLAANSYTGATNISAGILLISVANAIPSNSAVLLNSGATLNLNSFDQSIGSLANGTSGGGTVSLGTATLTTGGNNSSTTFSGTISGSGGKIVKTGSGALTLSGSNTYSGGTTLENGSLMVNNNNALGTGTLTVTSAGGTTTLRSTVNGTTLNNRILFQGASANLSVGANGNFILDGEVDLNGVTRTFTGVTNTGQVQFGAGGISGSAGVNLATSFSATGQYVAFIYNADNVNTYTGKTTVGQGAFLVFQGTATNGAVQGDVEINGNGVVDYLNADDPLGKAENIADNATVTVNSTGNTLVLNGVTSIFTGFDLYNAQGTETIGKLFGAGTVGLSNSTLKVGGGSFTGVISDGFHGTGFTGGKLIKYGADTLVLSGNNTYTGATTVSGGNLQVGVNGVGRTGTGATTVDAGATLSGTGMVNGANDLSTTHVLNGTLDPGDSGGAGTKGILTIKGNLTATSGTSALTFDITDPTGTWALYVAANPTLGLSGDATTELNTDDSITPQADYNSRISGLADYYKNFDPAAGAHDKLKVNGTFAIDGSTTITVNNLGAQANLVAGQVFNIIDATTFVTTGFDTGGGERLGGTLGNLVLPTLDAAYLWDTTKFLTDGLLIVVDPPVYWTGGADSTSWSEAGNWVHGDGTAAVAPDATAKVVISYSGGAIHQNAMTLDQDLTIRELVINDANDTSLSGDGALKIAPVVDNGRDHDAIVVNSGAGLAAIDTDLSLSEGARITVNNVDTDESRRGLVLSGNVSAQKKLIKAGAGRLTFEDATLAIGKLHGTVAESLQVKFEGSGDIALQDSTLRFDIFSNGVSDKLLFTGSLEGGNIVLLQHTHFELAAADGTQLNDGDSWDLIDWSNLDTLEMTFTGDIASYFNLPTLGEGQSWGFDRFASHGEIYVVPEPSRAMLLLVGLTLLVLRRRRRS